MPYRQISKDIKERALWSIEHNYIPSDICNIFGIFERSLCHWQANQEAFSSVAPSMYPTQGRPYSLAANQAKRIYSLLEDTPEMYLDKIQDWLALAHDVHILKTTLFEHIRDAGLTYKILQKTAAGRDNNWREEWLKDINTHFTASQFAMIDKTSKDDQILYQHYRQVPKGHRAVVQANFVWGEYYSLVAALTLNRYLAMNIVHGSVNGEDFFDFIVNDVVHFFCLYLWSSF
ncbi:hypothetical protein SERLA73DRAFT_66887 [Serpula lacrymans var. lacrymans S7.3]|uniref:Transposase n=1 Tax=Serpula lacrymans var. lacrymans (strain S7.3) TaxID=936435 RepID=F8QIW0_SERL3|nr:hypothetical protein SERLA73DRAFT_66887 [Serpula lacrymans var. lacrymans S7.3]